jgi:hypothetical protein
MLYKGLRALLEKETTLWQEVDRMFSAFAQAIRADPEKVEAMARNIARNNISHSIVEVLLRGKIEIPDDAATFTHKMTMLIYCCVVTMKPLSKIEFLNFSLSRKDMEVSIDCPERNPGYL